MWMFFHRIMFMISRASIFLLVPIAVLWIGGEMGQTGSTATGWIKLFISIAIALFPVFIFKFVIRVSCPSCGSKLDREVIGASNYECDNCGRSYS